MRPAERAVLVAIVVAIAAALRIAFVAIADVQSPLRVDAGQYAQYAANLVDYGTYSLATEQPAAPDSFRSPGYPLLLALCRLIGGEHGWYGIARWLQVLLSTATVLVAYRLARQFVGFGPSVAAAVLVALSPHLVVAPAYILTECTSAFVVTTALWLVLGARSRMRSAGGALVLGYAVLCSETMVYLPLVIAALTWQKDRVRALLVLSIAMLPFAIWQVRNQTTELARRGSERAVASISHGSYPGMVYRDPRLLGFPYHEDPEQPAFGQSWGRLVDVLGSRVAERPLRYVRWYLLEKPVWLWSWPHVQGDDVYIYPVGESPYERQPVMAASRTAMRWLHVPVMLLAVLGVIVALVRGSRTPPEVRVCAWVAVLGTLAYMPVIPDPRYLQPVRPVLFVLAAAALPLLLRRTRRPEAAPSISDPAPTGS